MWGFIVAGVVVMGVALLWARHVAPIRRLSKHLHADDVGIMVGAGDQIRWSPDLLVPRVLPHIQHLPGFDNETLLRAVGSTEKAVFPCWKRSVSAQ
jgi:hypothetical protein